MDVEIGYIEIGSYEAKTKLPELLRGILSGNRYTIKLRGEPVADLIPSSASPKKDVAAGVAHMQQLIASYPPLPGIDSKALIEEGRD
jgi:antitoxin (DNA-binding transcriptional repressor) of toxin-antitoxin stability system